MAKIKDIKAREILDSRGNPTVEVDITLDDGSFGRAAVPSGGSIGSYEDHELRDGEERYWGMGAQKAINNVNKVIRPALVNNEFDQEAIDYKMLELDGTKKEERLGANAILGVSLAFARAQADSKKIPLYQYFHKIGETGNPIQMPVPMMNILNGGKHARGSTDLQEFMIIPLGAPSFREALRFGAETFHKLKELLANKGLNTNVGDEGGFAPAVDSNESAINLIIEAIEAAGFKPGEQISLGIDAAATTLFSGNIYHFKLEKKQLTSSGLVDLYAEWVEKYPIISIEDGLDENDWEGYRLLTEKLGDRIQIVGDDLFVTNTERLEMGISRKVGNAIIIKFNQAGTLIEAIETVRMANKAGYKSIISHRSGETEDTTIADLAVGLGTGQIKTGSLSRGERICKYNQLLRIEEELGEKAVFPGRKIFRS